MRRKASWYPSDFLDALRPQCFSAVLCVYLATVTNAITCGGLLGEATDSAQVGGGGGRVGSRRSFGIPPAMPFPLLWVYGWAEEAPRKLGSWAEESRVLC